MYVIPKQGFVVRDPHTKRALPAIGREVGESLYWHRRLRDGDVALGAAPVAAAGIPEKSEKPTAPAEA